MKRAVRVAAFALAGLVGLVAVILSVGAMLPVAHSASVRATYRVAPSAVWEAITAYEAFPEWRSGVDRVEARAFSDGSRGWIEYGSSGPLPMAVDVADPPRLLTLRIASDALPFGGTWTYELEETAAGTRVTITEDGTVTNVLFRFISRFVFGHTATMERYLADLGARLGEPIEPVVVTG